MTNLQIASLQVNRGSPRAAECKETRQLFQRFPGVEGSLYFVGGFSLNYNRTDDVTLAPVRFGVGWRQGASVGYLHFTPKMSLIPV